MQPIPFETLVDLAEGRIAAAQATALRARVAMDREAAAMLASLEELLGLMRSDDSVDAPEHMIQRAARLIRQPAPAAPGVLQRVIAVLRNDSWTTARLAAGLRSVQAWPRALLLSAGEHELDLQIVPHGEHWQIQGQVLGPEGPGTAVLSNDGERYAAALNELGEFALAAVAAGRYTLAVRQGTIEIIVNDLEVGPSSQPS
jgi:hypothetical protein